LRKAMKRHGRPARVVISGSKITARPFWPATRQTVSEIDQGAS
jgi:hypothetical protein